MSRLYIRSPDHFSLLRERTTAFQIRSFTTCGLVRAILHHFPRDKDMSNHKDGVFLGRQKAVLSTPRTLDTAPQYATACVSTQ